MKQILSVASGVLLAGLIGWAVVDSDGLRHSTIGYSDSEKKRAEQEFETQIALSQGRLDQQLLEAKIQLAEARFGEGRLYRLCHESAPTAKSNQVKCKQLDDRMARADADDAKHPW